MFDRFDTAFHVIGRFDLCGGRTAEAHPQYVVVEQPYHALGEFVEHGTTEQVIFDGRQPYTRALMGSMLSAESGQKSRKPVAIEGAPPNLKNPIKGCRFADRCPVARLDCPETEQLLRIVAGREVRCKYAETSQQTLGDMGASAS